MRNDLCTLTVSLRLVEAFERRRAVTQLTPLGVGELCAHLGFAPVASLFAATTGAALLEHTPAHLQLLLGKQEGVLLSELQLFQVF